jgi:uncharacterized protein YecE (DUF72 family)
LPRHSGESWNPGFTRGIDILDSGFHRRDTPTAIFQPQEYEADLVCLGRNLKMTPSIEKFFFRDLHAGVSMGTASDRYAGWLGQIYSPVRFAGKISKRSKTVGGQTVTEELLPVESVQEYFQHFSILELDFTFYSLLLDDHSNPTPTLRVLETYRKHLKDSDRIVLKVPQTIFAQKLWKGGKFAENPGYLNAEIFIQKFYTPALKLLGPSLQGFIFEQEYQAKKERPSSDLFVSALDRFFETIPKDDRYHVEVRTEALLTNAYFQVLEKHGIGQVLSHWTWLPPLRKQLSKASVRFYNAGKQMIVRLMTPIGMRYEEAYLKAFPFDKMVEGMMSPRMPEETAEVMLEAVKQGVLANVIINNRAGGNAPLIAQKVAGRFVEFVTQP